MARLVDQPAVLDLAHLVHGIAELEAAILGMHAGLAVREVLPVDVNYARHSSQIPLAYGWRTASVPRSCELTPSALSLRCSAERSMPTNSAVREMLPPKRLIWASRYSRSKISRASRSGSDIRCSAT